MKKKKGKVRYWSLKRAGQESQEAFRQKWKEEGLVQNLG